MAFNDAIPGDDLIIFPTMLTDWLRTAGLYNVIC